MTTENGRITLARKHTGMMLVLNATLIPLLVAAIGLPLIGELYLVTFEPAPRAAALGAPAAALIKLISYAPAIAAASAVILLQPVLVAYSQGRFVSETASAAFVSAGSAAIGALLLKLLGAPFAIALLGGAAFSWRFDPLDVALMVFAATVMMIGVALDAAAAALKADNDQIV